MKENWVCLAFVLVLASAQDSAPPEVSPAQGDPPAESLPELPPLGELPEEVSTALVVIRAARERGELDAARAELRAVFDRGLYEQLLAMDSSVVRAGLAALDDEATALNDLRIVKRVREDRVECYSTLLDEDHVNVLGMKLNLGSTLYDLREIEAAHELFEHVHAGFERVVPPDHAYLLAAKQNLAATRKERGDVAGALQLEEQVHAAMERLHPPDHPSLLTAKQNLAVTRGRLGDIAGAAALEQYVHDLRERLLPPEDHDLLSTKGNLAVTLGQLGDHAAARALLEQMLAVQVRILPWDHPELLWTKQTLAFECRQLGDVAGSLALEEQVHAAREQFFPADHPELSRAKIGLAEARKLAADPAGARALIEQVHDAYERTLPADHEDLLDAKLRLAGLDWSLGDLAGALALSEQVHVALERSLPADHPKLLAAKLSIARYCGESGDHSRALLLGEQVLAARERNLPADHPELFQAKQVVASARGELGNLASALMLEEQVLAARERLFPADHPEILGSKLSVARIRRDQGDFAGALALVEQVLAARERALPPDDPQLIAAKEELAIVRLTFGDLAGSLALGEHVLAVRERALPPDHRDLIRIKANLGVTRRELGDIEGAHALFEQVHAASVRQESPDHPAVFQAKLNLGVTSCALGDLVAARTLFEEVHDAFARLQLPDSPMLVLAQTNLSGIRYAMGDFEGALALCERVHAARERVLPDDHPDLLLSKLNLVTARYASGDASGSLKEARSLLAGQTLLAGSLHGEAPRVARALALRELKRLSEVLFFSESASAAGLRPLTAELFGVIESLRIVSTASREVAHAAALDPELARLRGRVAASRRELNDHIQAHPDEADAVEAWRAELLELSDSRDRLERDLRTSLAREGRVLDVTAAAVASRLAPGSALVSYLRYQRHLGRDREVQPLDSLLAYVVSPEARVERVELGPSAEIEDLVLRWRESIGCSASTDVRADPSRGVGIDPRPAFEDELAIGAELRKRILDPCLAIFGERSPTTLHVVLDDFLYLVPMDALPASGGDRLGEGLRVFLETSVQRLVESHEPTPDDGTLVALGGADYDAEPSGDPLVPLLSVAAVPPVSDALDRSGSARNWKSLAHTTAEVTALAALFAVNHECDPVLAIGARASKSVLCELAPRARYLHIATHGWFAPETFTSLIDGVERELDRALFARAGEDVRGFAPETLCGLVLAGANRGLDSSGKAPGILTAEELAALDLSNCELAVLSACETNVGLRRAGQGIQSLQTALQVAGVRTAITSLWKVDDAATRRLMQLFYTHLWVEGLGAADALWRAKMALRDEGQPLRAWAAWVLSGEPE